MLNRTNITRVIRYLIFILIFHPVLCHGYSRQLGSNSDKDFTWLSNYIDEYHQTGGFSGTVLIAKGGKTIFQKAIGWQDIAKDVENSMDTRFNLGSGNKMFTAIAIAQLVEQGKIDYFSTISTYLPNYPDKEFALKATVHQLLTHSSGLGDFRDEQYKQNWHNLETLSQSLPFVTNKPLKFEPGSRHAYSNSGFLVLGLIVEAVSGQSYFDYVKDNIYGPSQMLRTDSYKRNGTTKDLAVGYQGVNNEWYEAKHPLMGTSAGGGFSTALDMLDFSNALFSNKLTTAQTLSLLTTDKAPSDSKEPWYYGYGFIVRETKGIQLIGHGGRAAGVFFEYYTYPELDYTFIIFSNSDAGSPEVLFNKINNYITDSSIKPEIVKAPPGGTTSFKVELVTAPGVGEMVTEVDISATNDNSAMKHLAVSVGLIEAIHSKDLDKFNSYFADLDVVTKAANESMFKFMTDEAIPFKGKVVQLHALSDPLKLKQSEYPMRVLVFHTEDGSPGSVSFSLDNTGKIDYLSLFMHERICSNRKTKTCDLVERRID